MATAHSLASAGHKVTVLEAVAVPGEIGVGIQVASSAHAIFVSYSVKFTDVCTTDVTRILTRWGLASKLEEIAGLDKAESVLICRCKCLF